MIIDISGAIPLATNLLTENVNDVVITGSNNPTVYCTNSSGVRFVSSGNVTIEGITWQGCGYNNSDGFSPAISFYNSSEVTVQSCTFNDSAGQVLSLSMMSGGVTIDNCQFANNNEYDGQGVSVYYTSLAREINSHCSQLTTVTSFQMDQLKVWYTLIVLMAMGMKYHFVKFCVY